MCIRDRFNSKCGVDFSLDKIKPAFENTPVEPAACGLWWLNTISPDPDERAAVRRTMLEFLDMAEAIGCRMAFFNTGEYDPEDPDKNICLLNTSDGHHIQKASGIA